MLFVHWKVRQSFEELHVATIKCWSNERGTDQWTDTAFLPSSRCSVSSTTTCTLDQLSDFLWMLPHHKPDKQRQHSSFNQQMSKEKKTKHTECLLPSQSFLKRWQGFGIRWSAPNVPPHFLSHREYVCSSSIQSRTEPLELPNLPACCSSGGTLWLASYTRRHIPTHTEKVSSAFFPLTFPIRSLARFLSLALHLWLYLAHFIFLVSFSLPLHLQPGEAHVFSTVSSAGSVWFKAIMWLQKET